MTTLNNKLIYVAVAVIVSASTPASLSWQAVQAQELSKEKSEKNHLEGVEVTTPFSGTLKPTNPKGATVSLHVEIKKWDITGGDRSMELPDQGFYVAHLVSGDITTKMGDKSQLRHPGDFWTVEKGTRMVVQIKPPNESAFLETVAVSPAH